MGKFAAGLKHSLHSTGHSLQVIVLPFGKRKRKLRKLKTADEEKALLEKSFPKSTRYVTNWSFNFFAQLQNARLNKQAANEEAGFDMKRDKIDTNIVNMTAESLNFLVDKIC